MTKFIKPEYLFALFFIIKDRKWCKIPTAYEYAYKTQEKIEKNTYLNVQFDLSSPSIEKMVNDYSDYFELKNDKIIRRCELNELASRFIPYIPNDILLYCF